MVWSASSCGVMRVPSLYLSAGGTVMVTVTVTAAGAHPRTERPTSRNSLVVDHDVQQRVDLGVAALLASTAGNLHPFRDNLVNLSTMCATAG